MHHLNPLETTETNSRRGMGNSGTNETRHEEKARKAASGSGKPEKERQKETEATADRPWRRKRTKQTEPGYEVPDLARGLKGT